MGTKVKDLSALKTPIQTAAGDIILSGHGSLTQVGETTVPAGLELWIIGPPGATILDSLGGMLEAGEKIKRIGVKMCTGPDGSDISQPWPAFLAGDGWSPCPPTVYKAGKKAPDYTLYPPKGLTLREGPAHRMSMTAVKKLSELWKSIAVHATKGQDTRVFWAACSALTSKMTDDQGNVIAPGKPRAQGVCSGM